MAEVTVTRCEPGVVSESILEHSEDRKYPYGTCPNCGKERCSAAQRKNGDWVMTPHEPRKANGNATVKSGKTASPVASRIPGTLDEFQRVLEMQITANVAAMEGRTKRKATLESERDRIAAELAGFDEATAELQALIDRQNDELTRIAALTGDQDATGVSA